MDGHIQKNVDNMNGIYYTYIILFGPICKAS